MELLRTIEIPQYIREVEMSKSRSAKYFIKEELGKKIIPLKYQNGNYMWLQDKVQRKGKSVLKTFLVNAETLEKIVANSRTVGKPKMKTINSQDIYSGRIREFAKEKMKKAIKQSYEKHLLNIPKLDISDFPIRILVKLYDTYEIENKLNWDVGNRFWIYGKCFEDCLTDFGIIPDDHRGLITQPPTPLFTPVEKTTDRKLIFLLYKDTRDEIHNNEHYKKLLNKL